MWYVTVENESRKECSEDAVKSHSFGNGSTEEHDAQHKDILHHGIAISAKEPSGQPRDYDGEQGAYQYDFHYKPCPEHYAAATIVCRCHSRHNHDGKEQRNHC